MVWSRARVPVWLIGIFVVTFLLFSAHFLYFFVDDEGIAFVYARNLVRGDGLIYNHVEPRAEGYSNFLHVVLAGGILFVIQAFGWPLETAFYVAKAFSMLCGAMVVVLVASILRYRAGMANTALVVALATISFAGPVGLWSATSLEMVPFTSVLVLFAARLWRDNETIDWVAIVAGVAVLLWRIDGFVYIAAVLGPAVLLGPKERVKAVLTGYLLPLVVCFAMYTTFRWQYFGSLLSEPIATKILYKFRVYGQVVTKGPAHGYLVQFLDQYGWIVPIAIVTGSLLMFRRDRWTLRLLATTMLLASYVAVVGDWMYGFRFFVPVLPFYAVLAGLVVAGLRHRVPKASGVVAIALTLWAGVSGASFARAYVAEEPFGSWLAHPSADPRRYFWRSWDAYQFLRPIAPPGTVTAYNQAGFIPFMLDAENIDDLGLCSRFVARLPTTDVFFTEVGRYSPLTPAPALRASEAYVLYWQPAAVIAAADLLRSANAASEPHTILGGRYTLAFLDSHRSTAVYLPSGDGSKPFLERRDFLENVAHVSRLRRALVNGVAVSTRHQDEFPFLAGLGGWTSVNAVWHSAFRFGTRDVPVLEIYIGDIRADGPVQATITLWSEAGKIAWEERLNVSTREKQQKHWRLAAPVMATGMTMVFEAPGRQVNVRVEDLRVQGQPPELRTYVASALPALRP